MEEEMMLTRRCTLAALLTVLLLACTGGLFENLDIANAQGQSESPKVAVLLPDDSDFGDYEEETEKITKISGSKWVTEFAKQLKFGDLTSDVGVKGTLYVDGLRVGFLFTSSNVKFVFYGLLTFPDEHPVNPSDAKIEYGVVPFLTSDSLVIALIDLRKNGEIGAFVVVPRDGNLSPAIVGIRLDSVYGVFLILAALPNIEVINLRPLLPVPSSTEDLVCPAGLTKVKDLNITLSSKQSITRVKDSSGADLFEIGVDKPNLLTVQSFSKTKRVDITYGAVGKTHLVFLTRPMTQQFELKEDAKFVLVVTSDNKQSCVVATPTKSSANFKITGSLSAK